MVRNERAQTLRYPLVLIARVVSSTVVNWSGAATALCLQSGIGISWINAKGESTGRLLPAQAPSSHLCRCTGAVAGKPHRPPKLPELAARAALDVLVR
ncbi:MAG: CRISPR-associated endonuclease Cas1 [Rhodoferax sp.]|nr:CRISPR-associated endonuclease Cas1 [Rhodoferax sp.]